MVALFLVGIAFSPSSRGQASRSGPPAAAKPALGTIKSIDGNVLTITTDGGAVVKATVPADAKLVSVPPGAKDLKEAAPITFSDLQPGDRILVRGDAGDDPAAIVAASVVAMKSMDIAAKQNREREEWQRHGIGGLVKSVDAASRTVTLGTMTAAGSKDVAVHVGGSAAIRRYAPDSVKFDEAKISSLEEVRPGDQLRARGTRSADGSEFAADEIVSGSFRNISGVISVVNAGAGTITISDLATKKLVEVKVTADSQVRKLPQPMAQRIAARLKGGADSGPGGASEAGAGRATQRPAGENGAGNSGTGGGGMGGGGARGGGDLQQMLSRLPASTVGDFQKGDAVLIVATSGSASSQATAITILGGVEPLLQASSQAASILTPWSLNSGGGADAGTP